MWSAMIEALDGLPLMALLVIFGICWGYSAHFERAFFKETGWRRFLE